MLPIKNDGGAWVLVLVYLCFGAGESFINHSSERGYSELRTNEVFWAGRGVIYFWFLVSNFTSLSHLLAFFFLHIWSFF